MLLSPLKGNLLPAQRWFSASATSQKSTLGHGATLVGGRASDGMSAGALPRPQPWPRPIMEHRTTSCASPPTIGRGTLSTMATQAPPDCRCYPILRVSSVPNHHSGSARSSTQPTARIPRNRALGIDPPTEIPPLNRAHREPNRCGLPPSTPPVETWAEASCPAVGRRRTNPNMDTKYLTGGTYGKTERFGYFVCCVYCV